MKKLDSNSNFQIKDGVNDKRVFVMTEKGMNTRLPGKSFSPAPEILAMPPPKVTPTVPKSLEPQPASVHNPFATLEELDPEMTASNIEEDAQEFLMSLADEDWAVGEGVEMEF